MQPAYVSIDAAIAKTKRLPIVICTRNNGGLVPLPLRRLPFMPPCGSGNAATLDAEITRRFANDAMEYVIEVCSYLDLRPMRIAIDAPASPRDPGISRRAAEVALDHAGIHCFATPSLAEFREIQGKVAIHLATGGTHATIPHSNQLWMLAGFEIFERFHDAIWIPAHLKPGQEFSSASTNAGKLDMSLAQSVRQADENSDIIGVRMSGCGLKELKRWPWGWDGHAAHVCVAIAARNPEARKLEYRERFAEHFRQH